MTVTRGLICMALWLACSPVIQAQSEPKIRQVCCIYVMKYDLDGETWYEDFCCQKPDGSDCEGFDCPVPPPCPAGATNCSISDEEPYEDCDDPLCQGAGARRHDYRARVNLKNGETIYVRARGPDKSQSHVIGLLTIFRVAGHRNTKPDLKTLEILKDEALGDKISMSTINPVTAGGPCASCGAPAVSSPSISSSCCSASCNVASVCEPVCQPVCRPSSCPPPRRCFFRRRSCR